MMWLQTWKKYTPRESTEKPWELTSNFIKLVMK